MAIFAITFRIHDDSTYDERYESVMAAITAQSTSTYWAETTSFYLIEAKKKSADLAAEIDANSKFADDRDLLVVINLTEKAHKAIGRVTDSDLEVLLKKR